MDTWSQARYTWFHWPGHAPGASLHSVCASVHHWIHQLRTHMHTQLHFKQPHRSMDSYPVGSPPPPAATDVAMATGKQILVVNGMSTPCTQVKFAILPFFSSLHLSFSGEASSMQMSFMTKGRHAGCTLMFAACLCVQQNTGLSLHAGTK